MPQPLTGYTVVEMGTAIQGPAAGIYLSDMGADVIKVEPPIGDASRYHRGVNNETPPETPGAMFTAGNRGKRSVCLDVNSDSGIDVVRRLVRSADVFMTNYRAPFLNRLGLDYASLAELNPNLIYASVNGFGPPWAGCRPADGGRCCAGTRGACQCLRSRRFPAHAGRCDHRGRRGSPAVCPGHCYRVAGQGTPWCGSEGQHVQPGHADLAAVVGDSAMPADRQAAATGRQSHAEHSRAVRRPMQRAMAARFSLRLSAIQPGGHFANTAACPNWRTIPSGITHSNAWVRYPMNRTMPPSTAYVRIWPRSLPAVRVREWSEFFRARDDVIVEKIQDHAEVAADPQTIANEYVVPMSFAGVGESRVVGNHVQLSETPGSVKGAPPELGNATREVMLTLGFCSQKRSRCN